MIKTRQNIVKVLADGKFHSGAVLADLFGISRTAVWKQVRSLEKFDLDIFSVRGKGYRLSSALELLDAGLIESAVSRQWIDANGTIQVLFDTDSTNQRLMQRLVGGNAHADVVLAEYQSSGRGRRGAKWVSPFAAGISMSMGWHFDSPPDSLTALSLAAGVAVVAALQNNGITDACLKWPNDIICNGMKLGGILIESRGETAGPFDVIIGTGINVCLPEHVIHAIDQPVTDIARNSAGPFSRNKLAGTIISELTAMLEEFGRQGFAPFLERWRELDYFRNKDAVLVFPDKTVQGQVLGIDKNGLLVMSINGVRELFSNGELSLRMRV